MMSRKKTVMLIVAVLFIVVTLGSWTIFHLSNQGQSAAKSTSVPFKISGLDSPNYLFSSDTQAAIVLGIQQYLAADDIKTRRGNWCHS